ncbi:helix-turn-helix transcriptional regulator [Streptomyces sp. NPDC089173]|uniref:helix-turn-helix domain-containing protein n=1 Tax=Streptomyces sp. NPDC089173 TaxID=3154965 RepID=UPI00344F3213
MANRKKLNALDSPEAAYGVRLREVREARGWRQDDLGRRCGYSGRHISGVETCSKSPTLSFSIAVDGALGFTGTAESFERECRKIRHGVLLQGFPEYVVLEGAAAEIRLFEAGLIPGLLQTREYAQALANGAVARGVLTPQAAEERVSLLMKRQESLVRIVPPVLMAVLDESCLHRPIGGSEVMAAQLQHLIDLSTQPDTTIQLVPYSVGERRPFDRLVNLLTLDDRSLVSYVESETQGYLDRENASVLPLVRAYHQGQSMSLSPAETVDMVRRHRKGIS